ncbi:DUF58 domain-containing protein [Paenibacillus assamensis]|uniref:DUF58 domain-containing protein n=1 Tax=Paenibacillus assamensis TaxID=311244 RepID=UPI000427C005|nr:DUF58 domain-containing protein [Paenibacillus assamensis]
MTEHQPLFLRRRNRYVPVYAACLIYASLILYFLFQGGKTSFMLLVMATILACYWLLGARNGIRKVTGARTFGSGADQSFTVGSSIPVHVEICVPGWFPIPYIVVKDGVSRFGKPIRIHETVVSLDTKRRAVVEYRIVLHKRGSYQFIETSCQTRDLFGLFMQEGRFQEKQEIHVLPQTITIASWPTSPYWRNMHHHDQIKAIHRRESTQLSGIREYVPGDRLSRIHWNATARTGELKSKQYEFEGIPRLIIVLDCAAEAYDSEEQFELAVSVAASLAEYGRKNKRQVNVVGIHSGLTIWSSDAVREKTKSYREWLASVHLDATVGNKLDGSAWISSWMSHSELQRGGMVAWVGGEDNPRQLSAATVLSQYGLFGSCFGVGQQSGQGTNNQAQLARLGFDYIFVPELNQLPVRLGGQK